jgi:hypothetical protein
MTSYLLFDLALTAAASVSLVGILALAAVILPWLLARLSARRPAPPPAPPAWSPWSAPAAPPDCAARSQACPFRGGAARGAP